MSQTVQVPAREGRAVVVQEGSLFRIVDVEGQQVADLFAFSKHDIREFHSAMHTRAVIGRLFPQVGEAFFTNRRRPILAFERDDTPGMHDMLIAPCDPERYQALDVDGWHASCKENLEHAMRELGYQDVPTPQPINLFMNVRVAPEEGSLELDAPETRSGDAVTLRAMQDAIIVVSACPQDIVPVNDGNPTSIAIEFPPDDGN